jgi:hypothetical protein
MTQIDAGEARTVREFRQILVWPLQLMPAADAEPNAETVWDVLTGISADPNWHEVADEFGSDSSQFQERHYNEFVAFLPYVQRMLYGEGKGCGSAAGESPIRVFRRKDVARLRLTFPDGAAMNLEVAHVDLYFFYDLDVVILVVEVSATNIPFERAHEILFRFGRSYPTYWNADGRGGHCPAKAEWLSAGNEVLAVSDFERKEKYLSYVCRYRAPCISSHWEFLLHPLVLHHSDERGRVRFRLVEYHRMPVCGYLTFDDPRVLTRGDFMRLALLTPPGPSDTLPVPEREARDFEERRCYDRFWNDQPDGKPGIRTLCSGETFIMVGAGGAHRYPGGGPDHLELFRHQYFLVFLIAHLHKASLFMLSDRLLHSLNRLDIKYAESVRAFKRAIRELKEVFLRFSHRYWFHEVSDQLQAKALYRMCQDQLGTERLYCEVRDEIEDMNTYLDSDSLRRQANMVIRLTVVTIFGLVGTVATGFLGMNLFSASERPLLVRALYFLLVFVPTIGLTFYTIIKSKKLSDFLDALSDERLPLKAKFASLAAVWKRDARRVDETRRRGFTLADEDAAREHTMRESASK